jgi:hypothetical protein
MTKRYDQYPQMSRLVRAMSDEGRELVAHWHRVLTTALEGYLPHAVREAQERMSPGGKAGLGAEIAIQSWLNVMREVAAILVDPSEADWCCKPGMLASPDPCPQHGYDPARGYELGTVLSRSEGGMTERAVAVAGDDGILVWRSVERDWVYTWVELRDMGGWMVVGRA